MGAFDFAPYVGPALGILGGLFGGGPKVNQQAVQDMNTSRGYLGTQGNVAQQIGDQAGRYGTLADYAAGQFGADDPAMRTATQDEIDYLRRDPNTDQADAQYLAGATRGTADAYNRGDANLTASLAARGFTGPSSNLTGGLTSLAEAQAAAQAGAANSLAQRQVAQADANRRGVLGLETGLDNTDYSRETQALGSQTGALGSEAGQYGSLANSYKGLSEYEQGQQNAQNAADAQNWGNIGETVGGAIDGKDTDLQDAQVALLNAQTAALGRGAGAVQGTPGIAPTTAAPGVSPLSSYAGGGFGTGGGTGGFGTGSGVMSPSAMADPTGGVSPVPAPVASLASYATSSAGAIPGVPPALLTLQTPRARAFVSYYRGGMKGAPPAGMDAGDVQDAVNLYIRNDPAAMAAYRSGDLDPLNVKGE